MASAYGTQPTGDGVQDLLGPAWQMRWRVPELALMLSDRAVAQARLMGDRAIRLRAEAIALFASNRLGRGVAVTTRAIAGVRDAEAAGDHEAATELRVELACCARSAGSNEVALRVLRPVLERERVAPAVRAHALIELAAALPAQGGAGEREALDEADRLYTGASELNRDTSRLLRAWVSSARAYHYRRYAEYSAAAEAAEAGLRLLEQLGDPAAESGEIHARLVLEHVQALFELGRLKDAVGAAQPVLSQPVRAASAGPSGWLRLALATRRYVTDGQHDAAIRLLNETVAAAQRHRLDDLLAEALSTSSLVHERCEDFPEALRCLRGAYAADRRWRAAVHAARIRLLEAFPALSQQSVPPQQTSSPEPARQDVPRTHEIPNRRRSVEQYEVPERYETPKRRRAAEAYEIPDRREHFEVSSQHAERYGFPSAERYATPEPQRDYEFPARFEAEPEPSPVPERSPVAERPESSEHYDQLEQFEFPERYETAADVRDAARRLMETLTRRNENAQRFGATDRAREFPGPTEREQGRQHRDVTASAPISDIDSWSDWSVESPLPAFPEQDSAPRGVANANESGVTSQSWSVSMSDESRSERPDVTTIMPVVPGQSDGWPDTDQASTPAYYETRLETEPEEPPAGRRSRGKSLAEIRASLQLVQERGTGTPPSGGRRRARHAEPDEEEEFGADEALPRHRQHEEPVDEAPDGSVGIADLLAEALMAYEDGRRGLSTPEPESRGRRSAPAVSGITGEPRPRWSSSDSEPPARHRRAAGDSAAGNPWSWTPPSY